MLDLLADNGGLASELVARTSSTLRVQEIVRLSLTPAFLLAAIGAVMNVMMSRLIWVADRIERLESRLNDETGSERAKAERDWLVQRRRLAQRAVMFSTLAADNINIRLISTSEIRISCVITEKYAELAVRVLHTAFGLDQT